MAVDVALPNGRPLPSSGAISGVLEELAFCRDANFARQRFERLGDVFQTKLLGQQLVFIRGERAITDLLNQGESTEGWWPESVKQLLGSRSLANRNGADHRARRRVVGQLFSASALRRYSPAIVQLVEQLATELLAASEPLRLADRMRRFAFAVIASVVLGLEGADVEALFADFEIWTRALFSVPIAIPGSPFARALQARTRLLMRLRGVLEHAQHSPTGGLDLLSGGVDEAGLPLTDDDLVEQLLLLLFAGYETTASSLSCLMAALLQHPQEAAWVQEEIQQLPWPLPDSVATPRLDAVVREVMRLNPPVGGFFRRTTRPVLLDGVLVPEGRVVQVALASSNRISSTASDLEMFRPSRHLEGRDGLLLLPFGGGERVCLGKALAELEIRLMAVGLLQQVALCSRLGRISACHSFQVRARAMACLLWLGDLVTPEELGIMGPTSFSLHAPPATVCPGGCWPAAEQLRGEEAWGSTHLQDHWADQDRAGSERSI